MASPRCRATASIAGLISIPTTRTVVHLRTARVSAPDPHATSMTVSAGPILAAPATASANLPKSAGTKQES